MSKPKKITVTYTRSPKGRPYIIGYGGQRREARLSTKITQAAYDVIHASGLSAADWIEKQVEKENPLKNKEK